MHANKYHRPPAPQRGLSIYEAARRLRDERDELAYELHQTRVELDDIRDGWAAMAIGNAILELEVMALHGVEIVFH